MKIIVTITIQSDQALVIQSLAEKLISKLVITLVKSDYYLF